MDGRWEGGGTPMTICHKDAPSDPSTPVDAMVMDGKIHDYTFNGAIAALTNGYGETPQTLLRAEPPTPTTTTEPLTRKVLHCPDGWHVEVWHNAYCPNCAVFTAVPATIEAQTWGIPQGHSAGYHPYSPPEPLMADDDNTNFYHPAKCVKNEVKK